MRILRPLIAAIGAVCFFALPASAALLIEIDKSAQRMTVTQDGARVYTWPVSTGIRGYDTPGGSYKPFRMEKDHFSREWDDAPMPHSIFFTKQGHAIHGTTHGKAIGRPASHGCVRLGLENARVLFNLVKQEGMANTHVVLSGAIPSGGAPAMARRVPRNDQPGADDDEVTGSATPRRVERSPREDRPIYWGRPPGWGQSPGGPPVYDDPYRRMPPPPRHYYGSRYGLD
jgi:hypothetical protein